MSRCGVVIIIIKICVFLRINNESGAMECFKQKVTSFWIKVWLFLGKHTLYMVKHSDGKEHTHNSVNKMLKKAINSTTMRCARQC